MLETYEKPYNPAIPVICMDEQPVQLTKDVKVPTLPQQNMENASITNTNVREQRILLCSPNLSPDGATFPRGIEKRRLIGRSRWHSYWKADTVCVLRKSRPRL